MKLAYGTYALPVTPLEEALPLLAGMGYHGVEVCCSPRHVGSLPDALPPARRVALKAMLSDLGLGVPAIFPVSRIVWNEDPAAHQAALDEVRACARLAHDLGAEPPVVAIGLGGRTAEWEAIRERLVERLGDYATLAREEGVTIAGEAHCGAAVDRSERVTWLFETLGAPEVGFHFDIVHLFLAGEDEAEAVARLLPLTVHTHITDARRRPDGFDLCLLGEGDLDAAKYVRAMHEGGWPSYITLEVSTRVWGQPEYDPVHAARFSYDSLVRAFDTAGVPIG